MMMLNTSFTKSVLTFYDEMVNNGISLVYLGEFNQEITKMFTSMAEDEMGRNNEQTKVKRKVYHVMVETLQNMNKHSDSISDHHVGKGLFIIGKNEKNYFIITSNKIRKERMPQLKEMIDYVNNASKAELKQMYLKQIKEGSLSEKGGAGLGIIDIARKTGEKYQYQFLPLDSEHYFFMLKVKVKCYFEDAEF
ncbi:SiaB family protein kinase [Rapidithrix thailandica]|uniref:SiaB family protein kinase n=1 Tax=Rapidithrix thailandica TaxID=413964 RepID=A0AAW9S7D4_9BACT